MSAQLLCWPTSVRMAISRRRRSPAVLRREPGRSCRCIWPVFRAAWMPSMRWPGSIGLHVVEDAAHAVGAWCDGRPIGGSPPAGLPASDAVAFSFYATKNLTTGEGGMLTTGRAQVAEAVRSLSLHGTSQRCLGPLYRARQIALRHRGARIQVQPQRYPIGHRHSPASQAGGFCGPPHRASQGVPSRIRRQG